MVMHFNLSYQCCASGIFPRSWHFYHPGFRILDPGSNNSNKRGGAREKIWTNSPRITIHLTQNIVTKLSKLWVWDPGSGKNLSRIPDPGVKKASDLGSGSATLDDGWLLSFDLLTGWPCPPHPPFPNALTKSRNTMVISCKRHYVRIFLFTYSKLLQLPPLRFNCYDFGTHIQTLY